MKSRNDLMIAQILESCLKGLDGAVQTVLISNYDIAPNEIYQCFTLRYAIVESENKQSCQRSINHHPHVHGPFAEQESTSAARPCNARLFGKNQVEEFGKLLRYGTL